MYDCAFFQFLSLTFQRKFFFLSLRKKDLSRNPMSAAIILKIQEISARQRFGHVRLILLALFDSTTGVHYVQPSGVLVKLKRIEGLGR